MSLWIVCSMNELRELATNMNVSIDDVMNVLIRRLTKLSKKEEETDEKTEEIERKKKIKSTT